MGVLKRNGEWWIDTYINGRRIRRKVGPDKRTAELTEKKLKVDAAQGKWLGEIDQKRITFSDFFEQKFEPRFQGAASTKLRYETTFGAHFKVFFGRRYLHQIRPEHIEDYKALRTKKARASTINQEVMMLGAILQRAVEWRFLRENPVRKVKKLRVAETEYNTLTVEDVQKLLFAVPSGDWFYKFLVLALNTGMRVSEMLALTWSDIDFKTRTVRVVNDEEFETKSRKIRYIPMNDFLNDVLRHHPHHISSPLIFATQRPERQGQALHRNSVELRLNQAIKDAGIEGHYRIHDLRHTFGTRLADLGENPRTIMDLMGHSSIEVTMRYIHTSEDRKRQAVSHLGFGGHSPTDGGAKKAISARA